MTSSTHHFRTVDSDAEWLTVYDTIPFPVYVTDVDRYEIVEVNRAMREKTGAVIGQPCYKAIFNGEQPCAFCAINQLIVQPDGKNAASIQEHFSDDDDCWYQTLNALGNWTDGRRVQLTIVADVTSLKDAQAELAEAHAEMTLRNIRLQDIAVTDSLTRLVNRRCLDEFVANEVERCHRYGDSMSVIMLDVDHFKVVNDTFGHQIGDRVLVELAALLRRGTRSTDTPGRWGGEEFLIICPSTNLKGATAMAETLRRSVETHAIPVVGTITCSFGVSQLNGMEPVADLIARADAALYRSKDGGRNRVESEHPED
jgi:diguanylate cyclase (GGDEF)-like protein